MQGAPVLSASMRLEVKLLHAFLGLFLVYREHPVKQFDILSFSSDMGGSPVARITLVGIYSLNQQTFDYRFQFKLIWHLRFVR